MEKETESFDVQLIATNQNSDKLQLSTIILKEDYRKKWNVHEHDFVCLTKGGNLISNSLYRVGGFGADLKKDYFMLLKYVEAFYSDEIMQIVAKSKDATHTKDPKHLKGIWCIIDKNGVEKVDFPSGIYSPYLSGGVIYSINGQYYNIETKEYYCSCSNGISSTDYLFLENKYDKDLAKRGVMKINKKDGSYELFK